MIERGERGPAGGVITVFSTDRPTLKRGRWEQKGTFMEGKAPSLSRNLEVLISESSEHDTLETLTGLS